MTQHLRSATSVMLSCVMLSVALTSSSNPPIQSTKHTPPIVGATDDPAGGYWEVSSTGGVFSFGGAHFYGSVQGRRLRTRAPVVGILSTTSGDGYWVLAKNGGVFAFGEALRLGSRPGDATAIIPDENGYQVIYATGTARAFLPKATKVTPSTVDAEAGNLVPPATLMPESLFNRPVQGWPVLSDSAALVADVVTQYKTAYGSVGVNMNRPVYWVPAHQPTVHVGVTPGCENFTKSTGSEIPIPANAQPGDSSDGILTIYQPSSHTDWELWRASYAGGAWSACWGGRLDMATSDGVFPFPYGETASGISNLATEITEADVASGSIDHAIAIQVLGDSCDWSASSVHGGLYPADRSDCGYSTPGQPAEGQWFRFPPDLAMPSGLTPFASMVFNAIQTYGAIVVDQGPAVAIEVDQPSAWTGEGHQGPDPITTSMEGEAGYQVVANLPWQQLQAIEPPEG